MPKLNWKIEKRKLADLKLWDKNPRTITGEAFDRLKRKITEQGFHDILKIDTDNTILSGNQRKRACEELGMTEVFVSIPHRKLTDEEGDKVALSSNINEGDNDWDKLANEFDKDLLKSIGFSESELGGGYEPDIDIEPEDTHIDKKKEVKCPECGCNFEA